MVSSMLHLVTVVTIAACVPAVRQKVKDVLSFLADDDRLREARKAARKTRDKYVGYSSESARDKYSKSNCS